MKNINYKEDLQYSYNVSFIFNDVANIFLQFVFASFVSNYLFFKLLSRFQTITRFNLVKYTEINKIFIYIFYSFMNFVLYFSY